MHNRVLKNIAFGLFALITMILMVATIVEKFHGGSFVREYIYGAVWMVVLWGVSAVVALLYTIKQKLHRRLFTFMLHVSFLLIITGAFITYCFGVQGNLHLRQGDESTSTFITSNYTAGEFPFAIKLNEFEQQFYNGTFAPMDYISRIQIVDGNQTIDGIVSMNNIFKYRGYRFYQSGYDMDGMGTTLSISFDPYGIAITYIGYMMLFISLLSFFLERNSMFRKLLHHPALKRGAICLIMILGTITASASPKTVPRDVAEQFGNLHIYYNDRICPLQTLARNFTAKLYGKTEYEGLTAEQVLTSWFFFYDDWKHEPVIKVKGNEVRRALGIDGKYASVADFTNQDGYKLNAMLHSENDAERRSAENATEKYNIISMLCNGTLLTIYPFANSVDETVVWYSPADKLPQDIRYFDTTTINSIAREINSENWDEVIRLTDALGKSQMIAAASVLPDKYLFQAEKLYNNTNYNRIIAIMCMTLGIICFLLNMLVNRERTILKSLNFIFRSVIWLVALYLSVHTVLLGLISGHIPLSNGFETMQFMALCSTVLTLIINKKFRLALPFGFLICGCTMMVAMMGESTPQITKLMPVLQSPLLSIHVVVIMLAYTIFAFMMLNGIAAIILQLTQNSKADTEIEYLSVISRIMLYPALFLLAAGIFTGAIWANVSWGRYWGWDPKEVWALITMLVYSSAIHSHSLQSFRKPMFFHIFSVLAFLTVLITYFGVNFLLGGIHSYA